MNPNMLYKEIGLIDDDLIMEADTIKNIKPFHSMWKKSGLVACLAVVILGSVFLMRLSGIYSILPGADPNIKVPGNFIHPPENNSLIFNRASGDTENKIYIPGHFWQELTEEELRAVLPSLSDAKIPATAHFRGDGTLFNVDVRTKTESGTGVYIQLAPGEPVLDYSFDSTPIESEINGVTVLAGYYEDNYKSVCFANFKLDDVGYYVEFSIDAKGKEYIENEKEKFKELVFGIISGGAADFSVLNPVIPELKDEKLSMDEAYADEDFGSYLPKNLPKGFAFESSVRFINQIEDYLMVLWCKGLDDIYWRASKFSESDGIRVTSVADEENYDLALYPIPRADSVPEELREIVGNPIFRIEDLTLEAVKARAYTIYDEGDTEGYRMEFSVLYEGGILVKVNSKGVDPEYMFNQLIDINHQ